MPVPNLGQLSDRELNEYLLRLNQRIADLAPRLDTPRERNRRTVKVLRGTILIAGGLFTATVDPIGVVLLLLGGWDWAEGISDDAETMNRGLAVRRQMNELEAELDEVEAELRRR